MPLCSCRARMRRFSNLILMFKQVGVESLVGLGEELVATCHHALGNVEKRARGTSLNPCAPPSENEGM